MLQFQVAGAKTGAQRVLAGSRPFELRGKSGPRITNRSGVEIPNLDGSVYSTVIIGVWDRNADVPGLAVNILVPGDGGELEIAAGEMAVTSALAGTSTVARKLLCGVSL